MNEWEEKVGGKKKETKAKKNSPSSRPKGGRPVELRAVPRAVAAVTAAGDATVAVDDDLDVGEVHVDDDLRYGGEVCVGGVGGAREKKKVSFFSYPWGGEKKKKRTVLPFCCQTRTTSFRLRFSRLSTISRRECVLENKRVECKR